MTIPYTVLPLVPKIREAVFQDRVTDVATSLGVWWHHETDSRRTRAGWPDLTLCGRSLAVIELKTDDLSRSKPTAEQAGWLARLVDARQAVGVWRPRDWVFIHTALHRLAGRRAPDLGGLADVTRHRIRFTSTHPTRPTQLTGDFSTRADADAVRVRLTDPTHAEIVACDATGRPRPEETR